MATTVLGQTNTSSFTPWYSVMRSEHKVTKVFWGCINKIVVCCISPKLSELVTIVVVWWLARSDPGNGAPLCLLVWAAVTGRDSFQTAQGCRTAEGCTGKTEGACTRKRPQNCVTLLHQPLSPSIPWMESGSGNEACVGPVLSLRKGKDSAWNYLGPGGTCTVSPHSLQ